MHRCFQSPACVHGEVVEMLSLSGYDCSVDNTVLFHSDGVYHREDVINRSYPFSFINSISLVTTDSILGMELHNTFQVIC
jgi:hypothetical protein